MTVVIAVYAVSLTLLAAMAVSEGLRSRRKVDAQLDRVGVYGCVLCRMEHETGHRAGSHRGAAA